MMVKMISSSEMPNGPGPIQGVNQGCGMQPGVRLHPCFFVFRDAAPETIALPIPRVHPIILNKKQQKHVRSLVVASSSASLLPTCWTCTCMSIACSTRCS